MQLPGGCGRISVAMLLLGCLIVGTLITADGRQEIHAHAGQRADLQCVTPPTTISHWQRLYVQRPVGGGSAMVVYSFSEGREEPQYQDGRFRNRTQLSEKNLTLTLSDVGPPDEGEYECKIFQRTRTGFQLIHDEHLTLSVWASYEQPQIGLLGGGAENSVTCSAQGGYPEGHIEWKLPPPVADTWNTTESWSERHPHTHLYNVSGRLNISSSWGGSASCCVVSQEAELCSDLLELRARSGVGGQRGRVPVCMILVLSVLFWSRWTPLCDLLS